MGGFARHNDASRYSVDTYPFKGFVSMAGKFLINWIRFYETTRNPEKKKKKKTKHTQPVSYTHLQAQQTKAQLNTSLPL